MKLRLGRPEKAIKLWERTVEIAHILKEAISTLGLAYLDGGYTEKPRSCFPQVLGLAPRRLR
ncbi:hypothetical protein HRbin09_01205 [bacterium HR09]|nr:hypothetical protein HRbin09_01205 [bacterium HR09]